MKTYQVKLTQEEIEAALSYSVKPAYTGCLTEENLDRIKYLGNRLLKIKSGEVEVETENNDANQQQPKPAAHPQAWS